MSIYAGSPLEILPDEIGHLPCCSFSVQSAATVAKVVKVLNDHPDYPGVIVLVGNRYAGMVSRQRCFEQLGRPFGVEVFLRRSVQVLLEKIEGAQTPLAARTPIDQAVRLCLFRPASEIYEPVLVMDEDNQMHIIVLHSLLLAQSRLLTQANQVIQHQVKAERTLFGVLEWNELVNQIFKLSVELIPNDQAMILLEEDEQLKIAAAYGPIRGTQDQTVEAHDHDAYEEIRLTRQPLVMVNAMHAPRILKRSTLQPSSWLGLPLIKSDRLMGMFTLARLSGASFNREEVALATNFCSQVSQALGNALDYRRIQQRNQELEQRQIAS